MIKNKKMILISFISIILSCSQNPNPIEKEPQQQIEKIDLKPSKDDKIYKGDVVLRTQKEIDDFGKNNYTFIDGSLSIGNINSTDYSEEIVKLDALKAIKNINGELLITKIKTLKSVGGLTNLEKVKGDFVISGCGKSMASIKGFDKLTTINGQVVFGNNHGEYGKNGINEISGFNNVTAVESIFMSGNTGLKTFDCFNKIEEIEKIYIMDSGIEEMTSFQKLRVVNKNFSIEYSDFLTRVILPNLETVKGYFALNNNGKINGNVYFPRIKTINNLYLNSNRNFENYCDFADAIRQNKIDTLTADFNKLDLTKEQVVENCK